MNKDVPLVCYRDVSITMMLFENQTLRTKDDGFPYIVRIWKNNILTWIDIAASTKKTKI